MALSPRDSSKRRAQRVRNRLRTVANGRPRLSIFRSSKNIYAQIIDDEAGVTLAAASSLEGEKKAKTKGSDKDAAAKVGALVAQRAIEKASRTSSSTVAVICTTAGSRPWLTPRAKPA
jgi:large subunit ribosomal protein L18